MQPTYLPWIGYFDLIDQCDIFVFLDSVQFDKRSWQQRNRIRTLNGELWLTVPVLTKGQFGQKIQDVQVDPSSDFRLKHIKTIQYAYRQARFYDQYMDGLRKALETSCEKLDDLNIAVISWLSRSIGTEQTFVRSSTLGVGGRKVDLLTSICKAVGGNRYVSPAGARGYIDQNNIFAANDIQLVDHIYEHPSYRQLHAGFVPFLSMVDLLFNEGGQSLSIIRSGRKNA
jgi:hypothetical protein